MHLATQRAAQVLIKHGRLFIDDPQMHQHLAHLHARCHDVMSKRAQTITSEALAQSSSILTAAVASVLQRAPLSLAWEQLPSGSLAGGSVHAFEAVCAEGHLYSINVVDGTILLDGCPPSRLPRAILDHRLYRSVFGDCNFEVGRMLSWIMSMECNCFEVGQAFCTRRARFFEDAAWKRT